MEFQITKKEPATKVTVEHKGIPYVFTVTKTTKRSFKAVNQHDSNHVECVGVSTKSAIQSWFTQNQAAQQPVA